MELCRYLFGRFEEAWVRHVLGLPGDFFLPFFRALEEEPGIEPVILTHEPAVGYAADACARVQGLDVAAVPLMQALTVKATILIDAIIPPDVYSAPMQRPGVAVRRPVRK